VKGTHHLPDYVTPEYLDELTLVDCIGTGAVGSRCAMQEVRAWLGLDPQWDEIPSCVDDLCGALTILIQDGHSEWRRSIKKLLPRLVGSRDNEKLYRRESYLINWALRVATPASLASIRATVQEPMASRLLAVESRFLSIAPVVDDATSKQAQQAALDIYTDFGRPSSGSAYVQQLTARLHEAEAQSEMYNIVERAMYVTLVGHDSAVNTAEATDSIYNIVAAYSQFKYGMITVPPADHVMDPIRLLELLIAVE
jgi:hypothetical protein